jgi:hypothetical protein
MGEGVGGVYTVFGEGGVESAFDADEVPFFGGWVLLLRGWVRGYCSDGADVFGHGGARAVQEDGLVCWGEVDVTSCPEAVVGEGRAR